MVNTVHTQFSRNSIKRRLQQPQQVTTLRSVWQDNPTPPRARTASPQPAPLKNTMRPTQKNVNTTRTHQKKARRRQTIHTTLHLKPRVRAELERIAQMEGLSVSATGAAILEKWLLQNIQTQYASLLETVIDKSIGKHMRSYSNRFAVLLVRSLFTAEQTRSFVYNILVRHPGITDEKLNVIKTGAHNSARANLTRVTPQLKTLIETVQLWLEDVEKEVKINV